MKVTSKLLIPLLTLGAATTLVLAQEERPPREGGRPGGPGGPGGPRMMPIVAALDPNGDGVIDATEIANASAALKKLDKNGDGQLTAEEYRGQRPGPGGPGAPRGDGQNPPRRPSPPPQ